MPDDTTAAIQALIQQVAALTDTVQKQQTDLEGIRKHNTRLLDEVKDAKRAASEPTFIERMEAQERARKLESLNLVQNPDGTTRLASGKGDHGNAVVLDRETARDPAAYRAAKARAESLGVPLRIQDDGIDPTYRNSGKTDVMQSKVFTFDDTHERIRYVRADMHSGPGNVQRALAAEKEGYRLRPFRTLNDLPEHARTKFEMMEAAANAQADS